MAKFTILSIIIPLISIHNFAKTSEVVAANSRKHKGVEKNDITASLNARKVCMNVCNPPYYREEYPPTQGGIYNPPGWDQNYIPSGYNIPLGNWDQNSYPSYENADQGLSENQFYPQGDFGQYLAGCYRNMFRRKYKLDPGQAKPTIYNYKTPLDNRKNQNYRRNRNYNQDFMNCQLICYPVMVPSYVPSTTLAPTEVTDAESEETTQEKSTTTKRPGKHGRKIKRLYEHDATKLLTQL
ncbi:uncharacterized protein LOC123320040 isoform X2 [Coccinella septempunctata]|uniref:uncharacterized protein LOC123320040 isoform X2 n=1 Tax=Coccinella septempunctata TaxID=41139 RepID=UPI001D06EFE5|nr:uncharacterized protein LOC123320040 isoform X2 [Coccinella septempunctata]